MSEKPKELHPEGQFEDWIDHVASHGISKERGIPYINYRTREHKFIITISPASAAYLIKGHGLQERGLEKCFAEFIIGCKVIVRNKHRSFFKDGDQLWFDHTEISRILDLPPKRTANDYNFT